MTVCAEFQCAVQEKSNKRSLYGYSVSGSRPSWSVKELSYLFTPKEMDHGAYSRNRLPLSASKSAAKLRESAADAL